MVPTQPDPGKVIDDSWRTQNRFLTILRNAEAGKYGIVAAVACNIEQILGFVRAAKIKRSPMIIQFLPWALKFSDGVLLRAAVDAVSKAKIPIAIHLDCCQSPEMVKLAADLGVFDSIMIDMSHLEREANLRTTKELVTYCNERGVATEAVAGRLERIEGSVTHATGLESAMTTTAEIEDLISTGVDALMPVFGSGRNDPNMGAPQLDFERLKMLRNRAAGRTRLVLHGADGLAPDFVKKCIAAGLTKISLNRSVLEMYYEHLMLNVTKLPQTRLMEEGIQKVAEQTMEWMLICGSVGRASWF